MNNIFIRDILDNKENIKKFLKMMKFLKKYKKVSCVVRYLLPSDDPDVENFETDYEDDYLYDYFYHLNDMYIIGILESYNIVKKYIQKNEEDNDEIIYKIDDEDEIKFLIKKLKKVKLGEYN